MSVDVSPIDVWGKGGEGALELADIITRTCERCENQITPLYDWNWDVQKKIETVAKRIYGAEAIDFTSQAKKDLKKIEKLGLDKLPVCIAKTQKSLSDNPALLGRPKDFVVTVRNIEIASGAGFVIPITGNIMRMPGLPAKPAAENIDIDNEGNITGLF
jgi:formate--tetrahydrofolate ligase